MKAVIFAGGVGTRLWPLSRKKSPKQFEKIVHDKSTLQLAVERLMPEFKPEDIFISTGSAYVPLVREQLTALPPENILGEPEKRDVGPAVAYVAGYLAARFPHEPTLILWSDHLVKKADVFKKLIVASSQTIEKNHHQIIFIGQKARFASENLGWIKRGPKVGSHEGVEFFSFERFEYKPDHEHAKMYFEDPTYCWNLGYFISTPSFLLHLFKLHAKSIYSIVEKIDAGTSYDNFQQSLNAHYHEMPTVSFDTAVLEQLEPSCARVVVEDIGWSDVGAWQALKEALEHHSDDNIVKGEVLLETSRDNLIYNYEDKKMVVGIGLENIIVVNTGDVLLVADKDAVKDIKKIVESFNGTKNEHLT